MPLYLIRISKRKWERDKYEAPWLGPNQVPADVFTDLRVMQGALSIWHIEDDRSNLVSVVTALAANRDTIEHFDYGLFHEERVAIANVKLVSSDGDTPMTSVNHWHRDIVELTVDGLAKLAKAIFDHMEKERILKRQVHSFISEAVGDGRIDLSRVKSKVKEELSETETRPQ